MTRIHNTEVKNISEFNFLHDIINPLKRAKILNSYYSRILHGCMNTRKGRARFKNFCILLDSGCSSTIVMGNPVENLYPKKLASMQWNTQAGNITTNLKVKINFTSSILSDTNVVMWNCHVYESAKVRHSIILGHYLLI